MLAGLRTPGWWLAAVSSPFLQLHMTPLSLAIGYASGVFVSARGDRMAPYGRCACISVRRLLANQAGEVPPAVRRRARSQPGRRLVVDGDEHRRAVPPQRVCKRRSAGGRLFRLRGFGADGAACLRCESRLHRTGDTGALIRPGGRRLARLAVRNGARNPGRSTLSIGLMASASFLIVADQRLPARTPRPPPTAPTAAAAALRLFAESDVPIYRRISTNAEGREELGFSPADDETACRPRDRFAASQAGRRRELLEPLPDRQPRVLGVTEALVRRGGFAWGARSAARLPEERENPWLLLDKPDRRSRRRETRCAGGAGRQHRDLQPALSGVGDPMKSPTAAGAG